MFLWGVFVYQSMPTMRFIRIIVIKQQKYTVKYCISELNIYFCMTNIQTHRGVLRTVN